MNPKWLKILELIQTAAPGAIQFVIGLIKQFNPSAEPKSFALDDSEVEAKAAELGITNFGELQALCRDVANEKPE